MRSAPRATRLLDKLRGGACGSGGGGPMLRFRLGLGRDCATASTLGNELGGGAPAAPRFVPAGLSSQPRVLSRSGTSEAMDAGGVVNGAAGPGAPGGAGHAFPAAATR